MTPICNEEFYSLAEWRHGDGHPMPSSGILYTHVDNLTPTMVQAMARPGPYVLISHGGDVFRFPTAAMDSSIFRWFGVNLRHGIPRSERIPIGVADSNYSSGVFDHGQHDVLLYSRGIDVTRSLDLYACFCTETNPKRRVAYAAARKQRWITDRVYHNFHRRPLPYQRYLRELRSHRFSMCPSGAGDDTHRAWESLYVGTIPIVDSVEMYGWFGELLPMVYIESWNLLKKELLDQEYDRVSQRWMDYSWRVLTMEYWSDRITSTMKQARLSAWR